MNRFFLALVIVANALFVTFLGYLMWIGRNDMTLLKAVLTIVMLYIAIGILKKLWLFVECFVYFKSLDKYDVNFIFPKATQSISYLYALLIITLQSFGYFSSLLYFWLCLLAPIIAIVIWVFLQQWILPATLELFWLIVQFLLHGRYRSFKGLVMPLYSTNSLPLSMSFRGERFTTLFHQINAYDSLYEHIMRSVDAVFSGKSMHLVVDRRKNGLFVAAVKWWRIKIPVVVVLMHLNPDVAIEVHTRVYVLWGMFNVASKIKSDFSERLSKSSDDFGDEIKVRITWLV
jgi:hypothetical protein